MTDKPVEVTSAYRDSRRTTCALAGLGIAWSAAQIDVRSVSIGGTDLDLSGAIIPVVLLFGMLYSLTRCGIEFAMQATEARQWELAQKDFKLTVALVRLGVAALGLSAVWRSPVTLVFALVTMLLSFILAVALAFTSTMVAMPIMIRIRARQGRHAVAARAHESITWGTFATLFLFPLSLVGLSVRLAREPWVVRNLGSSPSWGSLSLFIISVTIVGLSYLLSDNLYRSLFALPSLRPKQVIPHEAATPESQSPREAEDPPLYDV